MSVRVLIKTSTLALALGLGISSVPVGNAQAQGFLGGIIDRVSPGTGAALDRWNRNNGRPVEQAGAAVLDYYAPGAGRAALRAQRMQDNNWGMPRQSGGDGGFSAGGYSGGLSGGGNCRQGAVSMVCDFRR